MVYNNEPARLDAYRPPTRSTFALRTKFCSRLVFPGHPLRFQQLIYLLGLVDHFFLDVEDRIRQALSRKAPERLVTRQMKIFREQWAGLGLAFDYALGLSTADSVGRMGDSDAEMAAA